MTQLPTVGQVYAKAGFLFRIDRVTAKEVYVCRMIQAGGLLVPMRVTVDYWCKNMSDAELSKAKVPARLRCG